MTAFSGFSVAIADGIARLTLNDPTRGNPIDEPFCHSICEAAIQLSENPTVRCLLMSAEGKTFSFGGDISAFLSDLKNLPLNIKRWTSTLHSAIVRLQPTNTPLGSPGPRIAAG